MIQDRLLVQIIRKIEEPLDPNVFERAAADLLEHTYPTLVPVPGGQDAGQDGITASPNAIILVSTTSEDVERNLRGSLGSHIKHGGPARRAIFATTRSLNRAARDRLREIAREAGFELVQIYAGNWFATTLYRDSLWRKELLGISGDAPALSPFPLSRFSAVEVPLIGRDADLERLRAADGDGVIVGMPGVGKSAILGQLADEGWGLFLATEDARAAADDLRELQPSRVIIDDAQFAPDRVLELRRLRDELGAEFRIVGVTWPGSLQDIHGRLPNAWQHELEELTRDEIVDLLRAVGLKDATDELIQAIVEQAHGRPGLAVTLAGLVIGGNIRDVATGDALFREISVVSKDLTGAEQGSVLGVLALSGDHGIDLETAAAILGIPLDAARRAINGLASGGIISETYSGSRQLVVLPEVLRFPIVKQAFFGGPGSLNVAALLSRMPSPAGAAIPLIGAIYRGANVPDQVLKSVLTQANDERSWEAYAGLGESQVRFALESRPDHSVSIASSAIEASPDFCITVLLQAAELQRQESARSESPLKELKKWLHSHDARVTERRLLLASVTTKWAAEGGSVEVALEAYAIALDPDYERVSPAPGSGRAINIRRGHLLRPGLEPLCPIWDDFVALLVTRQCKDFRQVIQAVGDWCYPGRMSGGVDDGLREFTHPVVRGVVANVLAEVKHRGLAAKLSATCEIAGIDGLEIELDEEYVTLFPQERHPRGGSEPGDYMKLMEELRSAAEAYADDLADLAPEESIKRLGAAHTDALEVGESEFQYIIAAASRLAAIVEEPARYVTAAVAVALDPNLTFPFLRAAATQSGASQLLAGIREVAPYSGIVAAICILENVTEELTDWAVANIDPGVANWLWGYIYRGEVPDATLTKLLRHPDKALAAQIADALFMAGVSRSNEVDQAWTEAVVEAPYSQNHSLILGARPDLLEPWVARAIERRRSGAYEYIGDEVRGHIPNLPAESRKRLLESVADEGKVGFQDLVIGLVGDDLELAKFVFESPGLNYASGELLYGDPDPTWLQRAEIALEHGWKPEEIVRQTEFGSGWGSESDHYGKLAEAFAALPTDTSAAKLLSETGAAFFMAQRKEAAKRERREEILGR